MKVLFTLCSGRALCHYVLMSGLQSSSLHVPALWPLPELKPHTVHPLLSTCHISSHKSAGLTVSELNYAILWSQHMHCHHPTSQGAELGYYGNIWCHTMLSFLSFCTTWTSMARGDWDETLCLGCLLSSATYCAEFYLVCNMQGSGNNDVAPNLMLVPFLCCLWMVSIFFNNKLKKCWGCRNYEKF